VNQFLGLELKFALLYRFFNIIPDQSCIPIIVEGIFGPDCGFYAKLKVVLAVFANVPVADMKVVAIHNRLFHGMPAYITGKCLHSIILLNMKIFL
jgi:hypothetical protein